jgi:hypothetical protein
MTELDQELEDRLGKIETQLQQLDQIPILLDRIGEMEEQINKLKGSLSVVSDLHRFQNLKNFLAAGKFKEADRETVKILLEIAGKTRNDLTPDDVKQFPCSLLRVIDRLWKDHSDQRFGFSVQLKIYLSVGGSLDSLIAQDNQFLVKLGDRNGWRVNNQWQNSSYEQWDFSTSAPEGCFPAAWWNSPYGAKMINFFFARLLACEF